MEGANLSRAYLQGVLLKDAHLEGASFKRAHLDRAALCGAHLEGASLKRAHLERVDFSDAKLEGANFEAALINEVTDFAEVKYDEYTDFTTTAISISRVEPDTLTQLQYNIRRKHWEEGYVKPCVYPLFSNIRTFVTRKEDGYKYPQSKYTEIPGLWGKIHKNIIKRIFFDLPAEAFWWISDYGSRTARIIGCFITLNLSFTVIYLYLWRYIPDFSIFAPETDPVSIIIQSNLFVFSITDVFTAEIANPYAGILVLIQVVLGYVLLAALVTRFAIMFQSLGRT